MKSWGITKIILAGVNGPYCIRYTAEDALQRGFSVYVSYDSIADYSEQVSPVYPSKMWAESLKSNSNFNDFKTSKEMFSIIDRL